VGDPLANGKKQPYRIMLKSGEPFAMAGIYARGRDHGLGGAENTTVTFAILTTAANDIMQPIHDRIPVILPLGREKNWLPPNPSGMFIFPPLRVGADDRLPRHTENEPRLIQQSRSYRATRGDHCRVVGVRAAAMWRPRNNSAHSQRNRQVGSPL
jgi:SOS response associated peptidase (SRAP)